MKRFTIDFNEAMVERLEQLKQSYGFTSLAEVVRHAIRFLSYIEQQREQGYEVEITLTKGQDTKTVSTGALMATR